MTIDVNLNKYLCFCFELLFLVVRNCFQFLHHDTLLIHKNIKITLGAQIFRFSHICWGLVSTTITWYWLICSHIKTYFDVIKCGYSNRKSLSKYWKKQTHKRRDCSFYVYQKITKIFFICKSNNINYDFLHRKPSHRFMNRLSFHSRPHEERGLLASTIGYLSIDL